MSIFDDVSKQIIDLKEKIFPSPVKSMLGDVILNIIVRKEYSRSNAITDRRTESGYDLSDNAKTRPLILNLTVQDNSKDYLMNRDALRKLSDTHEIVSFVYSGRDTVDTVMIMDMSEIYDSEFAGGVTYDIVLKQMLNRAIIPTVTTEVKTLPGGKAVPGSATSNQVPAKEEKKARSSLLSKISGIGG